MTSSWSGPGTVGDVDIGSMDESARAAHITGVTSNLHLAQAAAQALGDIPPILSAPNFLERGPDEKAVIIFVSFLCARVLEVSKEERAAQVIQHCYRRKKAWQPGLHPFTRLCMLQSGNASPRQAVRVPNRLRIDSSDQAPTSLSQPL